MVYPQDTPNQRQLTKESTRSTTEDFMGNVNFESSDKVSEEQ